MTGASVRLCLAALATLSLAGGLAASEPLTLRYTPEQGLAITYDLKIEANLQVRGPNVSQSQDLRFAGTFVETVKSVSGGRIVVTREFTKLQAVADGRREDAPGEVMNQVQTFTYNDRGELLEASTSGAGAGAATGVPNPLDVIAAGLVRIPCPEGPVQVGDKWSVSSGLTIVDDSLDVDAEATLVDRYGSAGMQVALTDTAVSASGTIQGGAEAPSTTMTVKGAILQSTRIEDGAILGMRARLDATSRFTMGGLGSLEVSIDDLRMEISVAG